MRSTAITSTNISESVTASQIQGGPEAQGPSSTAIHIPSVTFVTKNKAVGWGTWGHVAAPKAKQLIGSGDLIKASSSNGDTTTSSTRMPVGLDGETTNQNAHFQSAQSVPNVANHPSTTAKPSITTDGLNLQVPNRKTFFADSASTSVPFLDINNPLSPIFGTQGQAITANSESQNILPSGFTPSKGSAPILGSGASIPVLAPQISDIQPSIPSDSLLSYATTMPTLSRELSFLTINGQTVIANSTGRYSIDSQPLTKSGVITLSGTTISLAPNESHINVGMNKVAFGPSATAKFASGSNGTEVQRFSGNALGARDGLWGSSTMLLVFFVVLLWL